MDKTLRIKILIPTCNSGDFLKPSVESLLTQTADNFDIVVIDDYSTDDSIASLNELKSDPRIELIRNNANKGKAYCLNKVFSDYCGQTDYFILQDADDVSLPDRVERQIQFMEEHPDVGCSSSFVHYINAKGNRIGKGSLDLTTQDRLKEYLASDEPFGLFCPAVILRSEVFMDPALQFRGQFWPADDIDLWNRIAESEWKVLAQPEYLVEYRVHGASAVTSNFLKTRMQYEFVRACLRSRRAGLPEPDKETFLREFNQRPVFQCLNWKRKTWAKGLYRGAGFARGEGAWFKMVTRLAMAIFLQPSYVIVRLYQQLWSKRCAH